MLTRLILACCIAALLALLAGRLTPPVSEAQRQAQRMAGERWYELSLDGRHLGYLHTHVERARNGDWLVASDMRFAMAPRAPVAISETLRFSGRSPHTLQHAEQRSLRDGTRQTITLTADGDGFAATVRNEAATLPARERQQRVALSFALADYLAFELWLEAQRPTGGATVAVPNLDFERLEVGYRQFEVMNRNATGYRVRNPRPHDATVIQLDDDLVPETMTMAGLFDVRRTDRDRALAPRSALPAASLQIPLDRPLPNHTHLARLELGVEGSLPLRTLWPQARGRSPSWILESRAGSLSDEPSGAQARAASSRFPADHPAIRRLALEATGSEERPRQQVAALLRYVHGFLRYEDGRGGTSVLDLLDEPVGDCTEFADLFTTLARSLGLPARTVFGLAYADRRPPGFGFHAWNEVQVNDRWLAVDPTWNQMPVDATHLPLPRHGAATLQLITGRSDLQFTVRDLEYADGAAAPPG